MNLDNALELQNRLVNKIAEKSIFPSGYSSMFNALNHPAIGLSFITNQQYRLAVHVQNKQDLLRYEQELAGAQEEVDIEITGLVYKQQSFLQNYCRPLHMGVSISHPLASAGTLGCFVRKNKQPQDLFILSNNHVLANENRANKNDPIIQPAIEDEGDLVNDKVAELQEYVKLKPNETNFVDAAIARIDSSLECTCGLVNTIGSWQITALNGINKNQFIPKGSGVFKIGRSGSSRGRLISSLFKGGPTVDYSQKNEPPRPYRFSGTIAIEGEGNQAFSKLGDSGSLVFDEDGYAVGLIFAKSTSGGTNDCGITYVIPIQTVLNQFLQELDVELELVLS